MRCSISTEVTQILYDRDGDTIATYHVGELARPLDRTFASKIDHAWGNIM
jgi:hypothetical protein